MLIKNLTAQPATEKSERYLAIMMGIIIAIMPFSIDAYLPAIPAISQTLLAPLNEVELALGAFLFGSSVGQLVGGPWSDIKGRKPVALTGLLIYIIASLCIFLCQSIEQLLILRCIQAVGAGFAAVVVSAITRDLYSGLKAARMFALIGIIMMIAPLIAPMVGAYVLSSFGWRAVFLFLTLYGALALFVFSTFIGETKNSKNTKNQSIFSIVKHQYAMVFSQPQALGFLFLQGFCFASIFVFLTDSPFVYMKLYGVSPNIYPLCLCLNIVVMATCNRITAYKLRRNTRPEKILFSGLSMQLLCNLALLFFSLTLHPPFPIVLVLIVMSIGSLGLMTPNSVACYMEVFAESGGTAMGVLGTFQFVLAAFAGWLTTIVHNGTLVPMAIMMLACTSFGIILLLSFSGKQMINICFNKQ